MEFFSRNATNLGRIESQAISAVDNSCLFVYKSCDFWHLCCVAVLDRRILTLLEELKLNNQTTIALLQQLLESKEIDSLADDELGRCLPVTAVQELELISFDANHSDMKSRLVWVCWLHTLYFSVMLFAAINVCYLSVAAKVEECKLSSGRGWATRACAHFRFTRIRSWQTLHATFKYLI